MMHFDSQAVKDLEFDLIRLMLHDFCLQPTARLRMIDLEPLRDHRRLLLLLGHSQCSMMMHVHRSETERSSKPRERVGGYYSMVHSQFFVVLMPVIRASSALPQCRSGHKRFGSLSRDATPC
jgi:hypothetical protein